MKVINCVINTHGQEHNNLKQFLETHNHYMFDVDSFKYSLENYTGTLQYCITSLYVNLIFDPPIHYSVLNKLLGNKNN